ncbi:hypothetical protein FRC12_013508 [Ceratobasidium sp. 428]|nr:hypothetical protein FRC12_013508 [Ceratobasidium sp. 428]
MSGYDTGQPPPPPLLSIPSSGCYNLEGAPGCRFYAGHYASRTCEGLQPAIDMTQSLVTIRNYYRIVFALVRGSDHRLSLPVELVICICKYAGFISPVINRSLSDHMNCSRFPPLPKKNKWLCPFASVLHKAARTGPLSLPDSRALGEIEMTVQSRKTLRGQWESFFVRIHRSATPSEEEIEPHISELVWPCFDSETPNLEGGAGTFSMPSIGRRRVIDKSHEIWDYFQPGDQIEVAQRGETFDYPQTKGFEVTVCVRNRWEPAPAMLALA